MEDLVEKKMGMIRSFRPTDVLPLDVVFNCSISWSCFLI